MDKPTAPKKPSSLTADRLIVNPAQRTKLLTRVMVFYANCFANRPEGMKYLVKQRGIQGVTQFKNYQLGYADGSLLEAFPQDDDSLNRFKALGVLTDKGRELFHDCVVFPLFDHQGNVVNLYGRRLVDGNVNHLYLPGSKAGLWNTQAAKRASSLLLTESVMDALTLVDRGLHDVMPCYDVSQQKVGCAWKKLMKLLKKQKIFTSKVTIWNLFLYTSNLLRRII